MWCIVVYHLLLVSIAARDFQLPQTVQVAPVERQADCDLICIKKQYESILLRTGELDLPKQHEIYFGKQSRRRLQKIMMSMGLIYAKRLSIHDVTLELSENNLQLRVIEFSSASVVSEAFHIIPDLEKQGIRIEHVYTLLEQGFIGIYVGAVMREKFGAQPDLTVASAIKLTSNERNANVPVFLKGLNNWKVFGMGVAGGSMVRVKKNLGLLSYGAQYSGFKHEPEFQHFTGALDHQALSASSVDFLFRAHLPPRPNLRRFLKCEKLSPKFQKMCLSLLPYGQMKVYDPPEGTKRSYVRVGLSSGFGENAESRLFSSLTTDRSLTVSVQDIIFGRHWSISEASARITWGQEYLRFGVTGELELEIFQSKIAMSADLSFPLFGSPFLALHNEGMTRLHWALPIWIGNLQTSAELLEGALPTAGTLGGEINIGWKPTEKEDTRLKGMVLVDIEPLSPSNSFIYAKFSPITVQSLVNMFVGHSRWVLPKMLGSNGIPGLDQRHGALEYKVKNGEAVLSPAEIPENPEQFIVVFAPAVLETTSIVGTDATFVIQPGLTIIGQVTVLGVSAKLYARVHFLNLAAELDFRLDRISLGNGLVRLTAGYMMEDQVPEHMQNEGPRMYTSFRFLKKRHRESETPELRLSGALELFGARTSFDVELSEFGFHFKTELSIWDWFVAKCTISVKKVKETGNFAVRVYGKSTLRSLKQLARGFFNKVIKKIYFLGRFFNRKSLGTCPKGVARVVNAISSVKIASLKFDFNNLDDTGSFPAVVEFKITLLGMKIRYKAKEQKFNFGQELDSELVNTLASSAINDLEECVESCNNQCCTHLGQCSSEDLLRSRSAKMSPSQRMQEMSPAEIDNFMRDLDIF